MALREVVLQGLGEPAQRPQTAIDHHPNQAPEHDQEQEEGEHGAGRDGGGQGVSCRRGACHLDEAPVAADRVGTPGPLWTGQGAHPGPLDLG
jgi:hypothetical protein